MNGLVSYQTLVVVLGVAVNPAEHISEFKDEEGVFAIEWTCTGIHDATWDKALEVTVINTLASL